MINLEEIIKRVAVENSDHPCMGCPNIATREPGDLAYISAQYVTTVLMKECQNEEPDSSIILQLAQAIAILIKVS